MNLLKSKYVKDDTSPMYIFDISDLPNIEFYRTMYIKNETDYISCIFQVKQIFSAIKKYIKQDTELFLASDNKYQISGNKLYKYTLVGELPKW